MLIHLNVRNYHLNGDLPVTTRYRIDMEILEGFLWMKVELGKWMRSFVDDDFTKLLLCHFLVKFKCLVRLNCMWKEADNQVIQLRCKSNYWSLTWYQVKNDLLMRIILHFIKHEMNSIYFSFLLIYSFQPQCLNNLPHEMHRCLH